jgi:hypothetical protein
LKKGCHQRQSSLSIKQQARSRQNWFKMTGASNKKKVTIALATSAVCFVLLWWFFLMDRVNFTSYGIFTLPVY